MDNVRPAFEACAHGAAIDFDDISARPRSAAEAFDALQEVTRRLRARRDPRAAFSEVYAIITRRVAECIASRRGLFLEPAWVSRLSGRFCERYLETLAVPGAAGQRAATWAMTYRCVGRGGTVPVQEALLGLSAHINYDLPLGIHENIVELGGADDPRMLARYGHDHDAVNTLLEEAIPETFERLARDHGCAVSAALRARPAARPAILGVLAAWRARVWREVLSMLAEGPGARAARVQRLDRRARRIAEILTLPSVVYAFERRRAMRAIDALMRARARGPLRFPRDAPPGSPQRFIAC